MVNTDYYFKTDSNSGALCGSSFLDVYPLPDFNDNTFNPLMGRSNSTLGFTDTDAASFVMKSFQFAQASQQDFTLVRTIFEFYFFSYEFEALLVFVHYKIHYHSNKIEFTLFKLL